MLRTFGHAPQHRGYPAAAAQAAQHGPHPVLGGSQGGRQVGHAGQGHPRGDPQQSSLFVVQWLPSGRHCHPSSIRTPPVAPLMVNPVFACVESLAVAGWVLQRVGTATNGGTGEELFVYPILDIRIGKDSGLLISSYDGRKRLAHQRPWCASGGEWRCVEDGRSLLTEATKGGSKGNGVTFSRRCSKFAVNAAWRFGDGAGSCDCRRPPGLLCMCREMIHCKHCDGVARVAAPGDGECRPWR